MGQSREWTMGAADGTIVRAVLAGDEQLFGVLVGRCRAEFGRYAVAMLGDADAAADAMQEACIRAWRSLADCRDPDRFRAWFYRILANQCRTMLARRRPRTDLDDVEIAAKERPDRDLDQQELADRLAAALERLTAEQREAFVLKHVEGRSYEEMEGLLGVGVDALKMRVYRARDTLRSLMGETP
jgi:RNA polymerase sigma-70 factor (ECF subfamily)